MNDSTINATATASAEAEANAAITAHHTTYIVGEDVDRLQLTAQRLGLKRARNPMANVRAAVSSMLRDSTLEAARMHSVGTLGDDEHVDEHGTLHLMTLTRRKHTIPQYGTLESLFQQGPVVKDQNDEQDGDDVVMEEMVDTVEGGSLTAAIFGIVKGTVGPATLYLPRGFSQAGYAVGIASMILATIAYLYSAIRLLQCWKVEKAKLEKLDEIRAFLVSRTESSDKIGTHYYGSIPNNVAGRRINTQANPSPRLLTYPELAHRAFGRAAVFVQFGIVAMQFGVCLTYFIFVPQNLVESVHALFGQSIDKWVFLIIMIAIEIPLSWIQDIRKLTTTNILATFLITYGLLSCLGIAFMVTLQDPESTLIQRIQELPPYNDTWFLFVGTSFFVFEGSITLLVPLQEAVFRQEDRKRFPIVNLQVMSSIVVFYVLFALICWASFGNSVKTALTASLPSGTVSMIVQFSYSLAVILTFPLQAFPALQVVFHSYDSGNSLSSSQRNTISSLITCFLGLVAYCSIDYLGNVVSLLGSLVGMPIALIFPPLMHNILVKDAGKIHRALNYLVAGLGLFATGAASYTTITSWDKGVE